MAGEYLLVNPRRRRRRKRARVAARRRPHRRRRRTVAYNPRPRRRRRRSYARRHTARRRRHRNPRSGAGVGSPIGNLKRGFAIGAGAVVTNVATGFISKYLPATMTAGPMSIALKAGVGLIGLPMLLKIVPGGRKFASSVAIGAGVAVALDILTAYVLPHIPGISDYETPGLLGYGNDYAPEDIGAAENMYGDTIY